MPTKSKGIRKKSNKNLNVGLNLAAAKMYESGMSQTEIADILCVSRQRIQQRLKSQGIIGINQKIFWIRKIKEMFNLSTKESKDLVNFFYRKMER